MIGIVIQSSLLSLILSSSMATQSSSISAGDNCSEFFEGRHVCAVTFDELIATPEKYEGKRVAMVGFLGVDSHKLAVYPNKRSYIYEDNRSSIILNAEYEELVKIAKKLSGQYVRVAGIFSSGFNRERDGLRFGLIKLDSDPLARGKRVMDRSSTEIGFDVILDSKIACCE